MYDIPSNSMSPSRPPSSYGLFTPPQRLPRLEELYAERSYLLSNLQQENFKATDLLRKVPPLEETLMRGQSSQTRRRARKQIGWLRYRINETTRQERTIMNRLGELAHEIRSKERRSQIESEQRQYGSNISSPVGLYYGAQQTFSPVTPQVHLQEYPFPCVPTPQQQHETGGFPWRQSCHEHVSEMPSDIFNPMSTLGLTARPYPSRILANDTQTRATASTNSLLRGQRSSSLSSLDVKLLSTNTPPVPISKIRRKSVGCSDAFKLSSNKKEEGHDSTDESSESSQYSGYYVLRQSSNEQRRTC